MAGKVLLTGASGFVGGHLIEALKDEYTLHAISRKKEPISGIEKQFQWSDLEGLNETYHAVVHLAGLAHDTTNSAKEDDYFKVNRDLTAKLLGQSERLGTTRFIYLSSVKAAVDSTHNEVLDESFDSVSKQVYGRSKLAAEEVILNDQSPIKKVILRPVMIYGKGQKGNLLTLEKLITKGIPYPFKKWNNRRSLLYVKNLTFTIKTVLESPIDSGVYFVADDKASSTYQLLESIASGMGRKLQSIPIPNGLISFGLKLLPKRLKLISDKLLGNLEVSNLKLRTALNVKSMPYTTSEGFKDLYS